jgi:fluoride exporter
MKTWLALCAGASLGAILRTVLSNRFNAPVAAIPAGTVWVNLLGAYIAGAALLRSNRSGWLLVLIGIHVVGSILMALLGIASIHWLKS